MNNRLSATDMERLKRHEDRLSRKLDDYINNPDMSIGYRLWSEIAEKSLPLVDLFARRNIFSLIAAGGYPNAAVAYLVGASSSPIPRSVVDKVREYLPAINEEDGDFHFVELALDTAIERVGIDENA